MNNSLKRVLALVLVLMTVLSTGVLTASAELVMPSAAHINIPLTISTTGLSYPTTITQGTAANVLGTVTASYGKITQIQATITKGTKTFQSTTWRPNVKSVTLDRTINTRLKFAKLGVGTYTLKVVVTAAYNDVKKTTKTILNKRVKVVDKTPTVTLEAGNTPSGVLYAGEVYNLAGTVKTTVGKLTYVRALVMDNKGKIVIDADFKPNKQTYGLRYSYINTHMPFELLPAGNYTYKLTAKVLYNGKTYSRVVAESPFTVED